MKQASSQAMGENCDKQEITELSKWRNGAAANQLHPANWFQAGMQATYYWIFQKLKINSRVAENSDILGNVS